MLAILHKGGGLKSLFEGGLDWKGMVTFLSQGFRVFRDNNVYFTSQLLFDLLFICRLKDVVSLVIVSLYF